MNTHTLLTNLYVKSLEEKREKRKLKYSMDSTLREKSKEYYWKNREYILEKAKQKRLDKKRELNK